MRQHAAALGRADGEAGEVVVALDIHAGHLGGLAADQGAARLVASRGDAGDHFPRLARIQLAGCEVVQKEQRFSALHHQIVDAHRHQIDADRVVDAGLDRNLQLRPDPIGAGHQDRVDEPRRLQVEQGAEAAETAHDTRSGCRTGKRLDRLDQGVGGVDIHPGGTVGEAVAVRRA